MSKSLLVFIVTSAVYTVLEMVYIAIVLKLYNPETKIDKERLLYVSLIMYFGGILIIYLILCILALGVLAAI